MSENLTDLDSLIDDLQGKFYVVVTCKQTKQGGWVVDKTSERLTRLEVIEKFKQTQIDMPPAHKYHISNYKTPQKPCWYEEIYGSGPLYNV